jgi:hypothetical protein
VFYTILLVWSTLWQTVWTRLGKDEYDEVPESTNSHRGAFHLPVPPPSPLTLPVSLEQLLASQNAIMQRLVESIERQAGQSQQSQQPQESSYFNFFATQPPKFSETTNPLAANHWLHVTESKIRMLHCSEFQKTVCNTTAPWFRNCMVGHVYYHYLGQSPSVMG